MQPGPDPGAHRARRRWVVPASAAMVVAVLAAAVAGAAGLAGVWTPDRHVPTRRLATPAVVAPTVASTTQVTSATESPHVAPPNPLPITAPRPTAPPPPSATPGSRLASRLATAMSGFQGCLVVEDGNTVIYGHSPSQALAPASTEKLLTAAAALIQLGPGFRYETDVVATAVPSGGAVDDLWLVGKGDPVLSTPEYIASLAKQPELVNFPTTPLSGLADALVAAGVRTVRNGIHGDDSRYDRTRYLPSWPTLYQTQVDIGPLGALSVNEGLMALTPKPVAAPDPATFSASELARLLGLQGVGAAGAADGVAPAGAVVLARVQSPPLATIVAEMLRVSDNYTAELITRELDRHAGGTGTTPGGTAVTMRTAAALGLPTAGLHMVDGSGLDHGDRSTCQLELAALDLGQRANLSPLSGGLAVAGVSGTLIHRYVGTPFQGHLEAKTGSIDGVMAMVGHEEVGHPLRFALMVNGTFSWAQGASLEDRLVAALATYPEA